MTTPEVIKDLVEKVEAGSGPDREIDAEIEAALFNVFPAHNYGDYRKSYGLGFVFTEDKPVGATGYHPPEYSASIDAAVALTEKLLPGCAIENLSWWPRCAEVARDDPPANVTLLPTDDGGWGRPELRAKGSGATLARALLSATLRALLATMTEAKSDA